MANKTLFQSITSVLPRATTVNEAGGPAYKYAAEARARPNGGDRYVR